jgi:hypothetical protein
MGSKIKIRFVDAFKGQLAIAVIVVGAIVLAIPIFIFSLTRVLWSALSDDFTSWARPRKPIVAKN